MFRMKCAEGFVRIGSVCRDIDECFYGLDDCDSSVSYCNNTAGSYDCVSCANNDVTPACFCSTEGYHRDEEGACVDLNECDLPGTCDGEHATGCNNTEGSYECLCDDYWTGAQCDDYTGDGIIGRTTSGVIGLTGIVRIEFPQGSVSESTLVSVVTSTDTNDLLEETSAMFRPTALMAYQVCIESKNLILAEKMIDVTLNVTDDLVAEVAPDFDEIEAFVLVRNGFGCQGKS